MTRHLRTEKILVADKRDGKSLFGYQGPFRLVCPNDKAGARSVRMLQTLEFVKLLKWKWLPLGPVLLALLNWRAFPSQPAHTWNPPMAS